MFEDHVTGSQGTLSTVSPEPFADVTVLDLFTLIHRMFLLLPLYSPSIGLNLTVLYVFVNEHMTLQDPALRLGTAASQSSGEGIAKDSIGGSIRTALSQWRDHWQKLRATISNDEWASMGFYKNGYSFWLVLDLLTTKAESVEVVRHIEVNCDDKLKRLNVLLQGGSVAGEAE